MLSGRQVGLLALTVAILGGGTWAALASRGGADSAVAEEPRGPGLPPDDDLLIEARTKGDSSAPITVWEASDFQCPYCRQFVEETLPILEREYITPGKVRLIFLNFPLTSIHPNATAAHEFAMCAARQGRFWQAHDLLFRHQEAWAKLEQPGPFLMALADSVPLGRESLEHCVTTGAVRPLIQAEAEMSWRAGIKSTPSFVIEGGLLPGAAPIDMWRPILDSIYAAKTEPAGRE